MMWDGIRVLCWDFVELGKNRDFGVGYDHESQPEPRFHCLVRLIHEIKSYNTIFIEKQFLSK